MIALSFDGVAFDGFRGLGDGVLPGLLGVALHDDEAVVLRGDADRARRSAFRLAAEAELARRAQREARDDGPRTDR